MTLNQLFWKLTKEKFHPSWGCSGRSSKNTYNLPKIMLHTTTRTLILILHIRQSIYLVLANVLSASFLMLHITFDGISSTLSLQFWYKGIYTRYRWNDDMFILWNWISATFYKDREFCFHTLPKQHTFVHQCIDCWHH